MTGTAWLLVQLGENNKNNTATATRLASVGGEKRMKRIITKKKRFSNTLYYIHNTRTSRKAVE